MGGLIVAGIVGACVAGAVVAVVMMARQMRQAGGTAALQAALDAALQSSAEQRAQLAQTQAQTREAFSALSHEALRQNRQDFLHNADALLKPVRETLDRVQDQLASVDKAREGSFQAVATQLTELGSAQKQLREAAEGLTRSLKSPNVRGRWGELQLRRIVELAGMTGQCDFF